ncbi:MAG: acetyl-CoA C-acetyltransferase [Gemmataceae bacterium]|nr:acetyl-CoA C-acetyltransferase [Gemmataceae bacterium]
MKHEAVILSAVRTPIGKFLGGLSSLPAPRLGAIAIREALRRAGLGGDQVDEVIMGNVVQAGVGQNPARQAALYSDLPESIPAYTVNKVCGSGLKAVMLAAQAIRAGDANVVVAGGMESMSLAPFLLLRARTGYKYGDQRLVDALIHDGLWCAFENWAMGEAAEHIACRYQVSREEQDRISVQSHQRAAAAWERGEFQEEVVPVTVSEVGKSLQIERDEGIRADSSMATLGKLKPVFRSDGTVTAGNASQLSDGAAALVIASQSYADQIGMKPMARIVSYATSGVKPREIFIAPVSAIQMALEKAKLRDTEIDLYEINEAFAAQMLACNRDLKIDENRLNVMGGAIALGHPIGASGARVLVTLIHAMRRRGAKRGVASLCLGGGNAVAMVVESA